MAEMRNTEDLLRLLREDASFKEAVRRELLGEELLAMPQTLAMLAKELRELQATVARFIESTERRLSAIEERLGNVETDIATLKTDVAELKTDVAELKTDVAGLKTDVGTLKGRSVEDTYRRTAPSRFRKVAGGLRRMVIFDSARVVEMADEALASGLITSEEADTLVQADLVATALSPQGEVVVVAEISATIHQQDVDRAFARAEIARKAMKMPALAVVAGDESARVSASGPIWLVTDHTATEVQPVRQRTA
jgi:uncharacterized coiled-coil protein SlyX